ncbi:SufS family cysteine desulfurase [bacterium]|nr:SufS family cysteine desulfurase [bacterium]
MPAAAKAMQPATYPIEKIRADFPILSTTVRGKPLVFLDTAASAQKPRAVIDSITKTYESGYANIHRGLYYLSQNATDAFEAAREKIRAFINAKQHEEIILVRGATEGINLVAQTWGRTHLKTGDAVIISAIEHHANIVPWQMLRDEKNIELRIIPVLDNGELDFAAFKTLLTPEVKLLALTQVSNSLGTVVPVADYIAEAKQRGIITLIDGCQAATHMQVDVQQLGTDFYVFSGHKLYGPSGIGVLYGRKALLDQMPPWQGGGEMIKEVRFEKTTYNDAPFRFEAGTPAIEANIGLGAAIDYVTGIGMDAIHAHEAAITAHALEAMSTIPGLHIIAPPDSIYSGARASIVPFIMDGGHASDIGALLDQQGIAIRTGHHCAMPVMERFGVPATARASFGIYTSHGDIDAFAAALHKTAKLLGA